MENKKVKLLEIENLALLVDMETNKRESIDINNLLVHSTKKIHWKCNRGHSFIEKVRTIFKRKNKCFFCTGRAILPGENDLQTLYPEISKEWDVEGNGGLLPNEVSPFTYNSYKWCSSQQKVDTNFKFRHTDYSE